MTILIKISITFFLGILSTTAQNTISGRVSEINNTPFSGTINYYYINANIKNSWTNNNVYLELTYNFGSKFIKKKNRKTHHKKSKIE